MRLDGIKVIIIGGGIGGLATACALARFGARPLVLEQAEAIREVGAGLQVSPNGLVVLRALGLERALRDGAMAARAVSLRDYRAPGEVLRLDLAGLGEAQYHFVHRADLIALLEAGARTAGVAIRLAARVGEVTAGPVPAVVLEDGTRLEADLIIGADGLHSVTRAALNGPAAPRFTGQVAWRAIVPNDAARGPEAWVHMGPGRHLVSYPLRDGRQINLVAVREQPGWAAESWSQQDDPENLRAAFADFGPEAQALLGAVRAVGMWGLFRHPVARHWVGEGLALVGDAAHPTLPFMAQGACMALEDAWALAACLSVATQPAEGLRAYQALRAGRAARVIATASGNAWKYHLRARPLRLAAHAALRLGGRLMPARMVGQFDWIYRYDITAAAPGAREPLRAG